MDDIFDLGNLPQFPRMDEYFGLWMMEATRFRLAFDRLRSMDLSAHIAAGLASPPRRRQERIFTRVGRPEIEAASGKQTGGDGYAEIADGDGVQIAVIPLSGVLMKQLGSMDAGTSSIAARMDVRHAARNPKIGAILILADSPGGTVAGTSDLADEIAAAAAAKPCYALVEDLCASAAYWCVSACAKIFAGNATALIGSIGTYMAVADESAAAAMEGVKVKVYSTGELKGAGTPGTAITPAMDDYFQSIVDQTQKYFAAAIAKNRGMSQKAVGELATGAVWHAGEAQQNGLIDGIKTIDQVLGMLGAAAMKQNQKSGAGSGQRMTAAAAPVTTTEDAMSDPNTPPKAASLKELKAQLPTSSAEFREECLEKGLTIEQSAVALAKLQAQEIEDLKAKAKPEGVKAIRETIASNPPATPLTAKAARSRLTTLASTIAQGRAMPRNAAFREACRQDPEAHKAMVVQHNLAHGRKKQAAQFAEEFDHPEGDEA